MTAIAIRLVDKTESDSAATIFTATIRIGEGPDYEIQIQRPFSKKEEGRLAWYFEEWIHRPWLCSTIGGLCLIFC